MSSDWTGRARFELFSADEIARVAGVAPRDVRAIIDSGRVVSFRTLVAPAEAAALVRRLSRGAVETPADRSPLTGPTISRHRSVIGHAVSLALHGAALVLLIFGAALGLTSSDTEQRVQPPPAPSKLVYLMIPGPGGGGGGGGFREMLPPPPPAAAEAPQIRATPTPVVSVRRPPPRYVRSTARLARPVERRIEPISREVPQPDPPPTVQAPIAPVPAPRLGPMGLMASVSPAISAGSGIGRGVGSGAGTGSGPGDGPGLGPGSGGGTGGGPFRPGSGIEPPQVIREVRPTYTDEARRRGLEGDVDLEVVVTENGSVSTVRVVRGLGGGLDQRAIDAVRQWRFAPARRRGTPVAVVVQVSVAFTLR